MCHKSESIKNIAVALAKFNGEVSKIEKDSSNPHFKNKYASLDNIIDEIRPILTKHGLSIIQMPGGDGEKFTMTTMLIHESGEWIESEPIVMRPVKNDPQGIGSCATYARRYSLAAFLSLNTGEDDDGNAATQPQAPSQTRQQSSPSNTNQTQQKSSTTPAAGLISEAQANYATKLKKDKRISEDDFRRMVAELTGGNSDVYQLTKKQAIDFINLLTNYQVGA